MNYFEDARAGTVAHQYCKFADMNEINWIQYTIVILTIMFCLFAGGSTFSSH